MGQAELATTCDLDETRMSSLLLNRVQVRWTAFL